MRDIVRQFKRLQAAIDRNDQDVQSEYNQLRAMYRGDCRAIMDAFHAARDKRDWAGQLRVCLRQEIDDSFWKI